MVAEVSSMLSKGRVEVLINFMGNITRTKMQATELRRLEAAESIWLELGLSPRSGAEQGYGKKTRC
jgi:hypothetical protein